MPARDRAVHYHYGSSHCLSCTFGLGADLLTITQSASVRGSAGEPLPKVWDNLEARFLRGQLALVAAGPGTGKSAFVLNYALRSGVSCLYFSADSDAYVQVSRALAVLGGLDMADAGELVKSNDVKKISEITEGSPVRFSYNTSPTLTHIEYQIRAYEELYGDFPELVVVDNALDVQMDFEDDQSQSLDALMAWLHDMARTTGSCVIVLHHVTGPFNDADKPIPLSGVKGQIGRVPELILTLHKQNLDYSPDQLLCVSTVKNRGQRADPSGQTYAELSFNGQQMSIVDTRDTATAYQFSDPYEMEMYGF